MKKADTIKLLYLINISLIMFVLASCTDTSVQNIPQSIDYKSQVKFVDLVPGAGTATITMNGQQIGQVDPGGEIPGNGQPFLEIPAGSKTIVVNYANGKVDTFKVATDTDYKMRLMIIGDSSGRSLVKSLSRYVWQDKGTKNGAPLYLKDTTQIVLFNASPDITVDAIKVSTVDKTLPDTVYTSGTITFENPIKYKSRSSYIKLYAPTPTDYNIGIVQSDSTYTTILVHAAPQGRLTTVIYDYSKQIKSNVFTDD